MRVQRSLPFMVLFVCIVLALYPPHAATAASLNFSVNSTQDAPDATPGDGICAISTGECTLRAAVQEANAQPAGSTVAITVPAGTYSLTLGSLALTANTIAVSGAGSATTIVDAGGLSGVFTVAKGVTATLSGLTITNGVAATGGGINNAGALSLEGASVLTNTTTSASGTNGGDGGGIWSSGTLNIDNSLISGNSTADGSPALSTAAGNGGNGGGSGAAAPSA